MAINDSKYYLVLGPAASGVSTALDAFSDFGFIQVGDIPPQKFESVFIKLTTNPEPHDFVFTLSLSPEDEEALPELVERFNTIKTNTPTLKVLTLTAPDSVLVQRYVTSGRKHPFGQEGLQQGVSLEKHLYQAFAGLKDYSVDTSTTSTEELRNKIAKILGLPEEPQQFNLNITTFGFKYGLPIDAELVFDMRFIKNPFYVDALRDQTGQDQPVQDYIFAQPHVKTFFETWSQLVGQMLPHYQEEGKTRLNIAIGCTGGKHRSVCLAEALANHLKAQFPAYNINMHHREAFRWESQTRKTPPATCSV